MKLYGPVVYGFARKQGLQDADAADLMQDVMRSSRLQSPDLTMTAIKVLFAAGYLPPRCECKDICIPDMKRLFAPCCKALSCGPVGTIKVLHKVDYECDKCGYKREVKTVNCCK